MIKVICNSAKKHSSMLLPYLLAVVLSSSVFSVYDIPLFSVWDFFAAVICALVFIFCKHFNNGTFGGKLVITGFIFIDLMLFSRLASGHGGEFARWFFLAGDDVVLNVDYLLALLVSFPVIFSLMVYYFTQVLYRMAFLTLVSVIPCVLYVKVFEEISNGYLIIIAMLNIAIYIRQRYTTDSRSLRYGFSGAKSLAASTAVFITSLLLIASVIPKNEDAIFYDKFKSIFMNGNTSISLDAGYSQVNNMSGNADNYKDFDHRRMYTVWGSKIPYFKRQNFDHYNFESDRWYPESSLQQLMYTKDEWRAKQTELNLTIFRRLLIEAESYNHGFLQKYGLAEAAQSYFEDSSCQLYIQSNNFGAVYYLTSSRGIDIVQRSYNDDIRVTPNGNYRQADGRQHDANAVYQLLYYDENAVKNYWLPTGAANMDNKTAEQMLSELCDIIDENSSDVQLVIAAHEFYDRQHEAIAYNELCAADNRAIPQSITELAKQITEGCTYDWEKADALQNYFVNNGFKYDMEYTSPDSSPEYFLFKSKTGTCSDFASAYVLMARSLGLTVRYAEGYTTDETSYENIYTISDTNSHAFPEVYIQNVGWLTYEPTVPSAYSALDNLSDIIRAVFARLDIDYSLAAGILGAAALLAFIAFIVYVIVPFADERLFMYRLGRSKADKAAVMAYSRISLKHAAKIIKGTASLTPYELAGILHNKTECDIYALVFLLENIVYGGKKAHDTNNEGIKQTYISVKQAVKRYRKKSRRR